MPNILPSNTVCFSPTDQKEFLLKKQNTFLSSCSYTNYSGRSHPSQCLMVIYAPIFTQLRIWEGTRQSLQPHVVSNLVFHKQFPICFSKTDSTKTCNVLNRSKDTRKKIEQIKRVGDGSALILREVGKKILLELMLLKRHKLRAIWGEWCLNR